MVYYFTDEFGFRYCSWFYTHIVKKALEFNVNPKEIKAAHSLQTAYDEAEGTYYVHSNNIQ